MTAEKRAFDTFSRDDVLRDWTWKGNPLSEEQVLALKTEAETFSKSFLWKVLQAELQWFAIKTLIEKGKSVEDLDRTRMFGNIVQEISRKIADMSK